VPEVELQDVRKERVRRIDVISHRALRGLGVAIRDRLDDPVVLDLGMALLAAQAR
jgi:hypothetical protein